MNYFVYIEDVLGVQTNEKEFKWSYGTVAPKTTKENFDKCKIKLTIESRNSNEVFPASFDIKNYGKYHYFCANNDESKVYYERNFFGKQKLRYSIEIKENNIHVIVSRNYLKFIKYRFMNIHSMHYILTDIVAGLLLQNGFATIHCSAVSCESRTLVIFAPPNTGKTLTSIKMCKEYGYKFIAEDFALTDGETIWAVPWTSTFRYYDEINESKVEQIINRLTSKFPPLELIPLRKNKSIEQYLGSESLMFKSKITDIAILERGERGISHEKESGYRKILNLNRYEFNYHKAPSMVVFNYFNPKFSIDDMYEQEKRIIRKLMDNCNFMCVNSTDALEYTNILACELGER